MPFLFYSRIGGGYRQKDNIMKTSFWGFTVRIFSIILLFLFVYSGNICAQKVLSKSESMRPAWLANRLPRPTNATFHYQLTEAEQRLLCFCAYCLDKNDDVSLKAYKKLFQLKQEDLVKQCNYLRHKGFINYNGHRFFEYIILPECFFCAAYFLVEKHPEWLQAFKKFTFQPSNTCSYLWQVVEASLGNQPMPQTGVMDIKYVVRSVFPQCLNPQLRPLLMQFSPEILLDMLQKTLILNINKDQLTTEIMEYLQEVSCVLPIKEQTIFQESIQLGKYLLNGNGLTPTKPISPDGFLHYGLVKLYKGEYSEAIFRF